MLCVHVTCMAYMYMYEYSFQYIWQQEIQIHSHMASYTCRHTPYHGRTQLRTYVLASQNCPNQIDRTKQRAHSCHRITTVSQPVCGKLFASLASCAYHSFRPSDSLPSPVKVERKVLLILTQDESSTPFDPFLCFNG